MGCDTNYLNPHETALAVLATSMKKARLRLDMLLVNSITGGLLFVPGGLLFVALHSECPGIRQSNPGVLTFVGGANFVVGLFYVVIMGAELYNSNIMFFSLGFIRRSVNIYDLTISWIISLIGNLAGCLFATYLFTYVSTIGKSESWVEGSIYLLNSKNSYNFIETFIKAIAGNWFVCMAVYLQLMAKPIHVKLILMALPIFTFVSLGYTHVIADMPIMFMGMLNGGDLSVGKYIWKLLIPGALGNAVGGTAFTILVPYYLHLLVVEFDRKKLNLPDYEERDEQPDINMDSRVVRVKKLPNQLNEKINLLKEKQFEKNNSSSSESSSISSRSYSNMIKQNSTADTSVPYYGPNDNISNSNCTLERRKSNTTTVSNNIITRVKTTTPKGVFPVLGMDEIVDSSDNNTLDDYSSGFNMYDTSSRSRTKNDNSSSAFILPELAKTKSHTSTIKSSSHMQNSRSSHNFETESQKEYMKEKAGAVLEKAISHIFEPSTNKKDDLQLPRTTQDLLPTNALDQSDTYDN